MNRTALLALALALLVVYYFNRPESGSKADFMAQIRALAPGIEARYGIKQNITIAQASLESDFGQSKLASEGKNLFGIKVTDSWDGMVWTGATQEFVNGSPITIQDTFKAYPSWRDSVEDWAKLISGPYKTAYKYAQVGDLAGYGQALYNTGYSTHPQYASLLQDAYAQGATV